MDTDAVRAALGYDKVDYWGSSYGGEDVTAYATRFGQHLRSIALDAREITAVVSSEVVVAGEAERKA
jgi:pimeloyl-ACP methyl ester carboxylesterase